MVMFTAGFRRSMVSEAVYQAHIIEEIYRRLPGCYVLKNDPKRIQGIPDLLVLYESRWAALEVKLSQKAEHQPNQAYYIERFNKMSFGAFIYPENEEDVFNALQATFGSRW